jgi:hypothetical protein
MQLALHSDEENVLAEQKEVTRASYVRLAAGLAVALGLACLTAAYLPRGIGIQQIEVGNVISDYSLISDLGKTSVLEGNEKAKAEQLKSMLEPLKYFLSSQHFLPENFLALVSGSDNAAYQNMAEALKKKTAETAGLRLLLAGGDGTVVFDSSKGNANTLTNLKAKSINKNHDTPPEIIQLTGKSVFTSRFSTSTGSRQVYASHLLGKLGRGQGVLRLSLEAK